MYDARVIVDYDPDGWQVGALPSLAGCRPQLRLGSAATGERFRFGSFVFYYWCFVPDLVVLIQKKVCKFI